MELIHYGMTREEFAIMVGKHKSCFTNQLRALCRNGSFHAKTTRDKEAVTCPMCIAKLNKE